MSGRFAWRPRLGLVSAEVACAVALSSALVLALEHAVPVTGLAVLYLLGVLYVAIRHGETAGLVTAVLSVLALNFFFIEPKYRLTIADSENVAALAVLLIAAVVVGRLASAARERAAESERRAAIADGREREATFLAQTASSILVGDSLDRELEAVGRRLSAVVGGGARVELASAPTPRGDERPLRLPLRAAAGWLYLTPEADREGAERLSEPLARLLDVSVERRELAEREGEAEATRKAEVAKTAVLHAVSHDLRSPLTAMLAAVSALRSEGLSEEDHAELLTVLDLEGLRLSRLIADLLDLSRIEAGAVDPRPDWCDLRDVVAGAAEQVRAADGGHPIELRLPPDLPLVRADAVQIERVFFNLIENAVKFSPPGAPVTVTGGSGPRGATIVVRDQGRGIPSTRHRRVFEPFFRGRGEGGGSGLGLAICRGFVEANGGRISLQARPGEGAAFAVTLPCGDRSPAAA